MDHKDLTKKFYGTTTVGEKGQVCIPAEARQEMDVAKGEKLLTFGMGKNMLVLVKLSELAEFESHLAERLAAIRGIMAATGESSSGPEGQTVAGRAKGSASAKQKQ